PRTSAASARWRSDTPATRTSMKACPGIFGRPDDLAAHESAAIPPEIAPRPDEPVIVKGKPSAFFGTQLHSMLTYHNVRHADHHRDGDLRLRASDRRRRLLVRLPGVKAHTVSLSHRPKSVQRLRALEQAMDEDDVRSCDARPPPDRLPGEVPVVDDHLEIK